MANHHNLFSNCVSAWIAAVDRQVESQINTIVKIEVDRVSMQLCDSVCLCAAVSVCPCVCVCLFVCVCVCVLPGVDVLGVMV